MFLRLKPRHARPDANINDVVQNLRRKLNKVAGIKSFVRNPPAIRVGGRLSNAQYQYTLQDLDLESSTNGPRSWPPNWASCPVSRT